MGVRLYARCAAIFNMKHFSLSLLIKKCTLLWCSLSKYSLLWIIMRHTNTTTDIDLVMRIAFRIRKTWQHKFGNIITSPCLKFKCGLYDLLKLEYWWAQHHRENNSLNPYPWQSYLSAHYNTTVGESSYTQHTRELLCFIIYLLWRTCLPLEPLISTRVFFADKCLPTTVKPLKSWIR